MPAPMSRRRRRFRFWAPFRIAQCPAKQVCRCILSTGMSPSPEEPGEGCRDWREEFPDPGEDPVPFLIPVKAERRLWGKIRSGNRSPAGILSPGPPSKLPLSRGGRTARRGSRRSLLRLRSGRRARICRAVSDDVQGLAAEMRPESEEDALRPSRRHLDLGRDGVGLVAGGAG